MLIRTHMEDLKEYTNTYLYENYRTDKLQSMGVTQDPTVFKEVNQAAKSAEDRAQHEGKLSKMEAEMRLVFQQKVRPPKVLAGLQSSIDVHDLSFAGQREGIQAEAIRRGALCSSSRDEDGIGEAAGRSRGQEVQARVWPTADARRQRIQKEGLPPGLRAFSRVHATTHVTQGVLFVPKLLWSS